MSPKNLHKVLKVAGLRKRRSLFSDGVIKTLYETMAHHQQQAEAEAQSRAAAQGAAAAAEPEGGSVMNTMHEEKFF